MLGDFLLRAPVGSSGTVDIFLAEQAAPARDAIVKVLRAERSSEARVDEFLREAMLASRLEHQYAAQVYGFGAEPDGTCWIAMEHVRGSSLRALLEAQGPMPLERFVPLFERICEVVQTAHEQEIVHRDLNPDHVMVISRAGRLLPKVIDFGIAHALLEVQPSEGILVRGSPPYMAPELWIGAQGGSPAADQYALGALAYEALTGRPAFGGKTTLEIARAHARPARRPLGGRMPKALDAVIDRALARRAADRYANVLELAQAFRDASGIGKTALEIPQLEEELRVRFLAYGPQPLADSLAAYDAAKNTSQAREALRVLSRNVGWYVSLLALACRTRIGSGGVRDSESARNLIGELRRNGLTPAGWVGLAKQLTKPFAAAPDTYPIPELVLLLHPRSGPDAFAAVLEGSLTETLLDTSDEGAAAAIAREMPQVTVLLRATSFLLDYLLVVRRGDRGQVWMGARGSKQTLVLAREVPEGRVVLSDEGGVPVLVMWPLIQVAEAVPGHGEQMFLLSGPSRQGARLVSAPQGFAHHDPAVWEWFRDELFEQLEEGSSVLRGNPYRGLLPYRSGDAEWFFGREREAETVVNRLKLEPFVAIVGPSGVGKSSLVHAGVGPALEWRVVSTRPGRAPLAQLAAALANADVEIGDVAADDVLAIAERVRRAATKMRGLLVVVDQFEELLTLGCPAEERDRFVALLLAMGATPEAKLAVVITLRDDFLIRAQQLPGLGPVLARGIQLLGPLGGEALERIIVEPARRFGYQFEDPELPKRMVESVAGTTAAVALISFAATRLWELRDRHFHQLPTKAYEAIGGVTGALARHADETVDAMPIAERQLVRKAFRHLVTTEGTRAVLEREELHQLVGGGADTERLIERLVGARLLLASESEQGTSVLEIVHEALIREWPRLVEWRTEDVEESRFHEQLRAAARQWEDRGRPRGLLWRGDALAEYQLWRRRHAPSLTPLEAAFGDASVADAARGRRVRRAVAAVAIAVTAVFVVVLWGANMAANRAKRAAETLLRDSYFEQGRLRVLDGDKLGALAPLATAYRMGQTGEGTRLLLEEVLRPGRARLLTLEGHTDKVSDVAYSPDGKWLASGSSDGTTLLWDAATGARRGMMKHADAVTTLAFSPDSRLVASSSGDGTTRVWDVTAGREIAAQQIAGVVQWVAFSPDGSVLAIASSQRTVRLWRMPGSTAATELGHERAAGAMYCGDGSCIVTWDADKVIVWDAATRAQRASVPLPGKIWTVAISRSGALIAVGTWSGELVLLRGDGGLIARRAAHDDAIYDVAISPDESVIATGSNDRTVRLWDASGEARGVLAGHRASITGVRFTPAGDRIVTTSTDNTARLWSASGMLLGELTGHANVIRAAAITPDGARLATASWDQTVMVWDLARAQELRPVVAARDGAPPAVAFAPGGRRLAVARESGVLSIADVETGAIACTAPGTVAVQQLAWSGAEELAVVRREGRAVELWDTRRCAMGPALEHPVPIAAMAVGPGPRVVTAAADGVVRVFRGGRVEASFTGYEGIIEKVGIDGDAVYAATAQPAALVVDAIGGAARRRVFRAGTHELADVRFDRDRGRVIAASVDQFLYVWDAATGELMRKLAGTGPLRAAPTSPDGSITVGAGGVTPTIWDRPSGATLGRLEGHSDLVKDGAFLSDGLFASLAWNRTVLIWDVRARRALLRFEDVDAIAVADDRRAVALVSAAGVRIWSPNAPAPDAAALRDLDLR